MRVSATRYNLLERWDGINLATGPPGRGLEELEFRAADGMWEVMIGFERLWHSDSPARLGTVLLAPPTKPRRTYKTVRVRDNGTLVSLKHRDVSVPA